MVRFGKLLKEFSTTLNPLLHSAAPISYRLVGAGGEGATFNIILLVIGITNFQIKYNKIKHNKGTYYYFNT